MSGVAIFALGIWMIKWDVYMELTTVYFDDAPYILIGVGCAIVVVGSLGCLCTVKGFPALLYIVSLFRIHRAFMVKIFSSFGSLVSSSKKCKE